MGWKAKEAARVRQESSVSKKGSKTSIKRGFLNSKPPAKGVKSSAVNGKGAGASSQERLLPPDEDHPPSATEDPYGLERFADKSAADGSAFGKTAEPKGPSGRSGGGPSSSSSGNEDLSEEPPVVATPSAQLYTEMAAAKRARGGRDVLDEGLDDDCSDADGGSDGGADDASRLFHNISVCELKELRARREELSLKQRRIKHYAEDLRIYEAELEKTARELREGKLRGEDDTSLAWGGARDAGKGVVPEAEGTAGVNVEAGVSGLRSELVQLNAALGGVDDRIDDGLKEVFDALAKLGEVGFGGAGNSTATAAPTRQTGDDSAAGENKKVRRRKTPSSGAKPPPAQKATPIDQLKSMLFPGAAAEDSSEDSSSDGEDLHPALKQVSRFTKKTKKLRLALDGVDEFRKKHTQKHEELLLKHSELEEHSFYANARFVLFLLGLVLSVAVGAWRYRSLGCGTTCGRD